MKKTFLAISLISVFSSSASSIESRIYTEEYNKSDISSLIYNGSEYESDDMSFYARILIGTSDSASQSCGASILDDQHILTAAHCLYSDQGEVDEFGKSKLTEIDPSTVFISMSHTYSVPVASLLPVDSLIIHEEYSDVTFNNDIAVIKLKKPLSAENWIEEDNKITSIPFFEYNDSGDTLDYNNSGEIISIIGLGITDNASTLPDKVMTAELGLETDSYCKTFLESGFTNGSYPADNNKMLCATGQSKACSGDSGGPISYMSSNGNSQIGIVSFSGPECEDTDIPGYYTEIYGYYDFLSNIVGETPSKVDMEYSNVNNINNPHGNVSSDIIESTPIVSTVSGSSIGFFALSMLAFVRLFRRSNVK